jgi:hypothetical protein
MELLERARQELRLLLRSHDLDPDLVVRVRPLTPREAIGDASADFVVKKGRETVVEAVAGGSRGQAFTDSPREWVGTIEDAFALDLSDTGRRAVFVAVLNALLRLLHIAPGTVHCRDDDPADCGAVLGREIRMRYGEGNVGLIGLQPAILAGLVKELGADRVRVLDRNEENVGKKKSGVVIEEEGKLRSVAHWCDVGLATGSSLVNGTIDQIIREFEREDKPLLFYGNTISGVASLLGLRRICPFAR